MVGLLIFYFIVWIIFMIVNIWIINRIYAMRLIDDKANLFTTIYLLGIAVITMLTIVLVAYENI